MNALSVRILSMNKPPRWISPCLVLFAALVFTSCDDGITSDDAASGENGVFLHDEIPCQDDATIDTSSVNYVLGEVLVGLSDTVTYPFFAAFFRSLQLEIINFDLGHNFWARADINDLDYYRDLFADDTTIVYINKLHFSPADTLFVSITFNGVNSLRHDSLLIECFGLHIYRSSPHPKHARLRVDNRQEQCWIDELNQYDFIKYAEPNYYTYIHLP